MKVLKSLLGSTIASSLTLISASLPLQAQTNSQTNSHTYSHTYSQANPQPNSRAGWYNCMTREAWSVQKTAWCNQMQQMMNASYTTRETGKVTLLNGKFDDRANQVNMQLINRPGLVATGDLNSDGAGDMVTLLSGNTGGSGIFIYLVAGMQEGSQTVPTTPILLGDRVQVRSVRIQDGKVLVDMIEQGPNDPMCCPTVRVEKTYELGYGLLPVEER